MRVSQLVNLCVRARAHMNVLDPTPRLLVGLLPFGFLLFHREPLAAFTEIRHLP